MRAWWGQRTLLRELVPCLNARSTPPVLMMDELRELGWLYLAIGGGDPPLRGRGLCMKECIAPPAEPQGDLANRSPTEPSELGVWSPRRDGLGPGEAEPSISSSRVLEGEREPADGAQPPNFVEW